MKKLLRWRFELISFTTGFSLLTYELAAARILAPSIGSSTYVWTGVIGVIIAALSIGFLVGGKLADRHNKITHVAWLLLLAGAMATLTLISYDGILQSIVEIGLDSRLQSVLAALVLFAPTSFFIGTTSPYLAKLNVRSLKSTGQAVASLDMFNAIGGITGTFVTGFVLFGFIGSHQAIGFVATLLIAASWLIAPRLRTAKRAIISFAVLVAALTPPANLAGVLSIDTASAHYKVITGTYDGAPAVGLVTGPGGTQSAVYQDGTSEPVFWYAQQMSRLAIERQPRSILILGGGAFTLPQYLSERLPGSTIDVVEIDPELEAISKQYFNYKNPSNVTEIFTDARTYVNQSHKVYDLILVDVYGDATIPFSLMTGEYGKAVASRLSKDGLLVANIIGSLGGECRNVLAALDSAYRQDLTNVQYARQPGSTPDNRANYIVAYSSKPQRLKGLRALQSFNQVPFSDNYAPAERLYYACEEEARQFAREQQ